MNVRLFTIAALLAVAAAPGCKDEAKAMSRYPYYITTLDRRWEVARESFRSAKGGNVGLSIVLLKDVKGVILTMKSGYDEPNRDAAIASLEKLARSLRAELAKQIHLNTVDLKLRPGHTAEDVGKTIEKAYLEYAEFRKMVKLE
ncbi:hypothetical protein LCGC14_1911300 [marine sediment metagenome]|uniref:Uncharacterized protein n=1 Tax=marine sediment metagenome TaxID=412755 RepID=A0A0F9FU57_9ZZZZ